MPRMMNSRIAFGKTLVELGRKDKRIVVLNADLSSSTKTEMFEREFPTRFFNFGIAEQNMMGTAAGLATTGKIVFASTFAMFATGRVYDQIRQSIAYPNLNVKIVATHAGITVGGDGASHQINEDIALMRVIPNMSIIVPADAIETAGAIRAAVKHEGPLYIRLGREDTPVIFDESYNFRIGKAPTLRDGDDVTIIAMGLMVARALEAADILAREGIDARVINMSTVKPIDEKAIIKASKETGAIVTAEEHNVIVGMGSAVAEVLTGTVKVPQHRVGIPDVFGESGESEELMAKYGLRVMDIVESAHKAIKRKEEEIPRPNTNTKYKRAGGRRSR
jgi:transketolase